MIAPEARIMAMPIPSAGASACPQSSQAQKLAKSRKLYSQTARLAVSPDW